VFTGDDVKWYNGTTGELKIKTQGINLNNLIIGGFRVYVDEEFLFELSCVVDVMSNTVNSPVLIHELTDNRLIIARGYPNWTVDYLGMDNLIIQERNRNWETIEPEWEKFIAQLKIELKYRE